MSAVELLHKRNKLLVRIMWGMLALGLIVDFLTGASTQSIIILASVGGTICAVAKFL